jgi:hypothetical protein
VQELTAGNSPESNGAAKRLQRTLMKRLWLMPLGSCLPAALWGEAFVAACFVWNRSPVSEKSRQAPCGLLFGCTPDVSNFCVFGCKVHAHVPRVLHSKLDCASRPGVVFGQDGSNYCVLLDGAKDVVSARDVVCMEVSVPMSNALPPHEDAEVDDVDLAVSATPSLIQSPAPDLPALMAAPEAPGASKPRGSMRAGPPPHEWRDVAAVATSTASPGSRRKALESPDLVKWQHATT